MDRKIICMLFLVSGLCYAPRGMSQVNNPNGLPWEWKTDTSLHNIDLSEVTVVLPKGSFPYLDKPEFTGKKKGLAEHLPKEPVIGIEIEGKAKAYPLSILTAHEVCNDSLGGMPVMVSYCPLCNSTNVYDPRIEHKGKKYLLYFEVSGMLRNSNLVLYDRQTESWWQQIGGTAIAGVFSGTSLHTIPSMIISVEDFFKRYPQGRIMSKNTGFEELKAFYGTNPYEGYDGDSNLPWHEYFDTARVDPRLPAMERIVNIESNGLYKIYPFRAVAADGVINDEFNGKYIVIFHKPGTLSPVDEFMIERSRDIGSATAFNAMLEGTRLFFERDGDCFRDHLSGSCWDITGRCIEGRYKGKQLKPEIHGNHFAFAWLAFYPGSVIFGK